MMPVSLKKEFDYFLEQQKEFLKLYNGKYVVIKNCGVIGVYDSEREAIKETSKTHELGTFLVQKCEPGENSYTMIFHSRVTFI